MSNFQGGGSASTLSGRSSFSIPSNHTLSFSLNPDDAVDSIEQDFDDLSVNSTSSATSAARTPSSSFSPPPHHLVTANHNHRAGRGISGKVLNLSDMQAAINTVSDDANKQQRGASSRLTPGPEHDTPRRGGRRSSGRPVDRQPHDLDEEYVPGDKFSDPTFQQAFNDSKAVAADLRRALASSDLHLQQSSAMARLHKTAVELEGFRPPATRIVGFVGDSGVGKSSLLNSLLDMEGLARTSNEGAACTCVATEYHYHGRDDFIIEIQLFTEDEVDKQILDLLKSYRYFHLHKDNPHDSEHVKEFEDKAAQAVDTFVAMFGRRIERPASGKGRSNVRIPILLERSSDRILRQMQAWAREIIAAGRSETRIVLPTIRACSDQLAKLTSEVPDNSSHLPWPFIRRIKVFANANILGRGLILVDLPGLRDLNKARRNIAERYLVDVDEIFAICSIGRATTDEGVQAVFELAARTKLSNVGIICTRSDDIRPEEAVRSWSGTVRAEIRDKMDDVDEAEAEVAEIQSNIEDLEDDEENLADEEEAELLELTRRKRAAERDLTAAKFGLQKLVVETRNANIEKDLRTAYQDRVPSGTLQVFCASNALYWQCRQRPRLDAMPTLLLSGIMAIREHCRAKVSDTQYRLCLEYMQDRIPALLGEVGLWVSSSEAGSMGAERRRVLRHGLSSLESQLRRDIDYNPALTTLSSSLGSDLREKLINPSGLRIAGWTRSASAASNEWRSWSHPSYSAFCRNYGSHTTKAVGTHCWNVEATEDMAQESQPIWQASLVAMDQRFDGLVANVNNTLDAAIGLLTTNFDGFDDAILPLRSALVSIRYLLETDLYNLIDGFHNTMRKLHIDALSGIRTSFVGKYMEPFYWEAIYDSGSGSHSRRQSCVGGAFSSRELFDSVLEGVKTQFSELADGLQDATVDSVQEHVDRVKGALSILLTDNAAREGDENPAFRQSVGNCLASAQSEMSRVHDLVSVKR